MRNGALQKKLLNDQRIDTMAANISKYFPGRSVQDILDATEYNYGKLEYMLSILSKSEDLKTEFSKTVDENFFDLM